jgi:hypothetical protein
VNVVIRMLCRWRLNFAWRLLELKPHVRNVTQIISAEIFRTFKNATVHNYRPLTGHCPQWHKKLNARTPNSQTQKNAIIAHTHTISVSWPFLPQLIWVSFVFSSSSRFSLLAPFPFSHLLEMILVLLPLLFLSLSLLSLVLFVFLLLFFLDALFLFSAFAVLRSLLLLKCCLSFLLTTNFFLLVCVSPFLLFAEFS